MFVKYSKIVTDMAANDHLLQSIHHERFKLLQVHLLQDVGFVRLLQDLEVIYNHHSPAEVPRQLYGDGFVVSFNDICFVYGCCHGIRITGDESLRLIAAAGLHDLLKDLLHKSSLICVLSQPTITERLKQTHAVSIQECINHQQL
ncbi:ATP synthase subunit delta [Labeo rohita]|uniref:ATP synthase subunit delta n=1 Tax=Labeo rohita TaxID=84645 RepID=A0ABQ8MC78_LABRO|nr:ATP synthase subunit delta [Labeo rohita]